MAIQIPLQLWRLAAKEGVSSPQGVQGELVSGLVAGLVKAAATPRGIFCETDIDREIATRSLCQQLLCITLRWWLAAGPVKLYE